MDGLEDHGALVRDLQLVDLSGPLGVPVSYPRPAGAHGVAEALDVTVSKLLREAHLREARPPTVTARVIASSPRVLGVLLDVSDDDGPGAAVIWYRAEGDRAVTSPALIREEQ